LDIIAIIAGFISIALTIILLFAFLIRFSKDEEPLPLADFRKIENVNTSNKKILWEKYYKETKRSVSKSMYLLALPDELQYIEWLELQATKLQVLKDNGEK